ncbi:hypothetical protein [Pedobacter sp. MC2016-24]|uniref:hypothetical protein n=1 Tax=Pedobacter sp. MC2016-24 TaxID=2780090 RepID=UPI0018818CBF|nr:hypothetical protein [Pedobacter sp. MC2016-24]MBE9599898.1 hypothetical protein [Pedobacter sp. MC2016-24]
MRSAMSFLFLVLMCGHQVSAQRIVFDSKHFQTVSENAAVRTSAELTHQQYLEKIDQNLQTINVNTGSIVLAQSMIYNGLSNVNSALKNGLAMRELSVIIAEILRYSGQMLDMAKGEPYLLLFAEQIGNEMKGRSINLVTDVSGFILSSNILADYNSRDQLMRRITQQLQIIRGLAYGAYQAMYWSKQRGIFKSVNPFAEFINSDRQFVTDIIRNAKYLKQ